jgi:uncharacterized protein YhdP
MRLTSEDLGVLFAAFGHAGQEIVQGGTGKFHLENVSWSGPPGNFRLEDLTGTLRIQAHRGLLTALDAGTTGRAFSLINIQVLARLLELNFGDLFSQGVRFDRIQGNVRFENGTAITEDLLIESPIAHILIQGRTHLVQEEYDQVITITPKISDSLPLSAIGLVQRLFGKAFFDEAFAYRYAVTGSFGNPLVTRLPSQNASLSR